MPGPTPPRARSPPDHSERLAQLLHHANATSDPTAQLHAADLILQTKDKDGEDDAISRALNLYLSASYGGSIDAARKAGILLREQGDHGKAEKCMRDAIEKGDIEACRILAGWWWADGGDRGLVKGKSASWVDEDEDEEEEEEEPEEVEDEMLDWKSLPHSTPPRRKAFALYLYAANRYNDLYSIYRVADCFASGEGMREPNMERAVEFWERAARKGDRAAVGSLARYYQHIAAGESPFGIPGPETVGKDAHAVPDEEEDCDVEEDTPNAKLLRYTRLAANDGDTPSLRLLAAAYQTGTATLPLNAPLSLSLYLRAARQGDTPSLFSAATLLHTGAPNLPRDVPRAFALYEQSAREGYTPSFRALAECYRTGQGAPNDTPNLQMAKKCFEAAAAQGCIPSTKSVGDCWWDGVGCTKDRAKAVEWYERAAEKGDLDAVKCLARSYWVGDGVEKDRERAKELITVVLKETMGDEGLGWCFDEVDDGRFEELMEEIL
ncbi:hypothetical protein HK104_003970 [Borealophlyctis nickersoniae]|nr:hypothetical protein HK104_003970 [Borealophlyctis nickersoniae]